MGFSFSFCAAYRKNEALTDEQIEALFTPVTDMLADLNLITVKDTLTLSVANYGSCTFVNMVEDCLRAAIYATMDPEFPTQLIIHRDDVDGGNEYIYIAHNAMEALEMELLDLNIELRALTRKRNELIEEIAALKGE